MPAFDTLFRITFLYYILSSLNCTHFALSLMYGTAPYLSTAFLMRVDLLGTGATSELIFGDSSSLIFSRSLPSIFSFCIFEPLLTSLINIYIF